MITKLTTNLKECNDKGTSDTIGLLPWSDQHALLTSIMRPSTGQSHATVSLRITLDSRLEFGSEMTDQALNRPGESFSQRYIQTIILSISVSSGVNGVVR